MTAAPSPAPHARRPSKRSRLPDPRREGPGAGAKVASSAPSPAARAAVLAGLGAATVAAFAGVLRNGWVNLDDGDYVYQNPHVLHGLRAGDAAWFLSHPHAANWHPLTSWCHQLAVSVFGLQPAGHHAVSLALHATTAVLLAWTLFRYTGAWWRSVLVAGFFALHPLRVESVAWASELKDVLSGLCFVLTLAAYRRSVERPGPAASARVAAALGLGLLAKPMLVTAPFVLVLLDFWPLGRWGREPAPPGPGASPAAVWLEKWPLFLLSIASAAVTAVVQRQAGAVVSAQVIPLPLRIQNAFASYGWYAWRTLWPGSLGAFYPFARRPPLAGALAGAVFVAAATAVALAQMRRRPYLLVGWLWYLGMLVPVIGLVQVGGQAHADRYTYLPTIGLALALVWAAEEALRRAPSLKPVAAGAAVAALVALSLATARQATTWRDTGALFTRALQVTRDNAFAHSGLGAVFLEQHRVPEAIAELEEAERIAPYLEGVEKRLGSALGAAGRYDEAVAHYRQALKSQDSATVRGGLGIALAALGRYPEALPELQAGLALEPGNALMNLQQAEVLAAMGRREEAVRAARQAVALARAAGDAAGAASYGQELEALAKGHDPLAAARVPGEVQAAGR